MYVNAKEYRKDNRKWTIQQDGKQKQKHNTICVGHNYTQTNTNNVNKSCDTNMTSLTSFETETNMMHERYVLFI